MSTAPLTSPETDTHHEDPNEPVTTETVLAKRIPWEGYQRAKMITVEELELIRRYDKRSDEHKRVLLDQEGEIYAELFIAILEKISNEETTRYALTLIDEMISDETRVNCFLALQQKNRDYPFGPFLKILTRLNSDWFSNQKACRILSVLFLHAKNPSNEDVNFLFRWLSEQLRKASPTDQQIALSALMNLLRKNDNRVIFVNEDGLRLLGSLLSRSEESSVQQLYQAIFCLWLLSFNKEIAARFHTVEGLVRGLVEVIKKESDSVKVRRISFATLRNLLLKVDNIREMIAYGLNKLLVQMAARKWADKDIVEDIEELQKALDKELAEMTSFEKYRQEVLGGQLDWSPVHRSDVFWRENITQFEAEDYRVVRVLIELLKTSANARVLAVACHDLGEFARFHPKGRAVLGTLNGKVDIMKLMMHTDPEVQKEALLAIQKIMVTNWEYLSTRA